MAEPTDRILIVNDHRFGHFTVYAANLAEWALSRGLGAVFYGRDFKGAPHHRRYASDPRVAFLERPAGEGASCRDIIDLQKRLKPLLAVLVNADELFFESMEIMEPSFAFPRPTYAVSTFGGREYYTCLDEAYTVKLNALTARGGPFAGVLTLDEHHAARTGPGSERVFFLPDMFREAAPLEVSELPEEAREDLARLKAFLDSEKTPVIPLTGKLDRRKSPDWILRLVAKTPGLACAVIGERVADPAMDDELDALLGRLQAEGRLFSRQTFSTRHFFDALLSHPRVRFLPLPYRRHYGSSAVALQGLEHGKPVLAPDQGLLARRIADHGLGLTYRPGDFDDFQAAFTALLEQGPTPYGPACRRFMAAFSDAALFAALDEAFGFTLRPVGVVSALADKPRPLSPAGVAARRAQDAALDHRDEEALAALDEALALAPGHGGLMLQRIALAWRAGRFTEAAGQLSACLAAGFEDEVRFLFGLALDAVRDRLRADGREAGLLAADRLFRIIPGLNGSRAAWEEITRLSEAAAASFLDAGSWREMGCLLAAAGQYPASEAAFHKALDIDPAFHACRLNLSDVRRYGKRHESALEVLDELARIAPDTPGLHCKRGQVFFETGRTAEAKAEFEAEQGGSTFRAMAEDYLRKLREHHS